MISISATTQKLGVGGGRGLGHSQKKNSKMPANFTPIPFNIFFFFKILGSLLGNKKKIVVGILRSIVLGKKS
jgi:hypothetical protein